MAITLRLVKGTTLTYSEADINFSSLIYSATQSGSSIAFHTTGSTLIGVLPTATLINVGLGSNVTATGAFSHAEGYYTVASGSYSHAEGGLTKASGSFSHAEGDQTLASGYGSHTEGVHTTASGQYSHAEGTGSIATGDYSHAEGYLTNAAFYGSHAEGSGTRTTNYFAHAEGNGNVASGNSSHAEGNGTTASGDYSHAEALGTKALGPWSHAEGEYTIASGTGSHAEGQRTVATGDYQHVQGQYNISSPFQSAFILGNGTSDGSRSNLIFASGSEVQISGSLTVGSGSSTVAPNWGVKPTLAIGMPTGSTGGVLDLRNTNNSISPGDILGTIQFSGLASGTAYASSQIKATVYTSPGSGNPGGGILSFWTGPATYSSPLERMRINNIGNVGIGTTDPTARLTLGVNDFMMVSTDFGGKAGILFSEAGAKTATDVQYGAKIFYDEANDLLQLSTRQDNVDKLGIVITRADGNVGIGKTDPQSKLDVAINDNAYATAFTLRNTNTGTSALSQIVLETASNLSGTFAIRQFNSAGHVEIANYANASMNFWTSGSERMQIAANGNVGIGKTDPQSKLDVNGNTTITGSLTVTSGITGSFKGDGSQITGVTAEWDGSHNGNATITGSLSNGNLVNASGDYSHAEGFGTTTIQSYSHAEGRHTTSSGLFSHAEGEFANSIGEYSHAEGAGTLAQGDGSHAEGGFTVAGGNYSHAEGYNTVASGEASHAEGNSTTASGDYSHAEGYYTVASGSYQHVQGQFNIPSLAQSAFIVGNGTSDGSRSNLLYASGSQVQITGSLRVNGGATIRENILTGTTPPGGTSGGYFNIYNANGPSYSEFAFLGRDDSDNDGLGTVALSANPDQGITLYGSTVSNTEISNIVVKKGFITIGTPSLSITTGISSISSSNSFKINSPLVEITGSLTVGSGSSILAPTFGVKPNLAIGMPTGSTGAVLDLRNTNSSILPGDTLGIIQFSGKADNPPNGYASSQIRATVATSPGSGNPGGGILSFWTGLSNTGAFPVERMRINNDGNMGIGITNPEARIHSVTSVSGPVSYGSRAAVYGDNTSTDTNYANSIGVAGKVRTTGGMAIYGDATTGGGWAGYFNGKLNVNGNATITGSLSNGIHTSASGNYSHAEGTGSIASGEYSHAEGYLTNAAFYGSHTEGAVTRTTGYYAHAEGLSTLASGNSSHAEGHSVTASGDYSHAEGFSTKALGPWSHTEGTNTVASGTGSHAEGYYTVASGSYQHVQGQFNISSSAQSAFIVGNGTSDGSRSNLIYAAGNTVEITGSLMLNDILVLAPRTTTPTPSAGMVIVSGSGVDQHIYCYLNSTWKQLD